VQSDAKEELDDDIPDDELATEDPYM